MAAAQSAELPGLERRLRDMEKAVEGFDLRVPADRALGTFLQQIAGIMTDCHLVEQVVLPGEGSEKQRSELCPYPRGVQAGPWRTSSVSSQKLQSLDRLVRVEKVAMENDSGPDGADQRAGGGGHLRAVGQASQNQWCGRGAVGRWREPWRLTGIERVVARVGFSTVCGWAGRRRPWPARWFRSCCSCGSGSFVGHRPAAAAAAAPPPSTPRPLPARAPVEGARWSSCPRSPGRHDAIARDFFAAHRRESCPAEFRRSKYRH